MRPRPSLPRAHQWLATAALGAALLSPACSSTERTDAEVRRDYRKELLKAEDRRRKRDQKREETRVQDDKGALLPSEVRVAGILLPRGLTLKLEVNREWYYETRVPAEAVRAYFGPRLNTVQVVPGGGDTVTYQNALPRDTPGGERVTVRIGPLPNQRGKTEINIRLAPIRQVPNSEAEARLAFEESQRYAQ